MQEEEQVKLDIPTVNTKIQRLFDNDPHSDIRVVYNETTSYNLNRSYLRVDSDFFKERMDPQHVRGGQLDIRASFRTADFEKVLKCLYGFKFMIPKSESLTFWSIAKLLKVEKLATRLKEVIINNLQQYDLFMLLQLANEYSDNDIFDSCMKVLDDCGYARLKTEQEQLAGLPVDLFKCLVIHHNKFRKQHGSTALSNMDINQLIRGYCGDNEKLYQELKSQLLSPQNLTSAEYERLYHEDLVQMNNNSNNLRIRTSNSFGSSGMEGTAILRNTSLSQTTNELVMMSSQNFLNKKRITELAEENDMLKRFVESFNSRMSESIVAKGQFDSQIEQLKKADELRQSALMTVEQRLAKLEVEMQRKDELLKKQEQTIGELKTEIQTMRSYQNQSLNFSTSKPKEEEDIMVTSKVLPGDYFKDIFKPQEAKQDSNKASMKTATPSHSKSEPKDKGRSIGKESPHKKSPSIHHSPSYSEEKHPPKSPIREEIEQPPEEEIDGGDRLQFSCQPTTITKQMYSHLMEVLEIDSFKKTQLQLLFRATKSQNNFPAFLKAVAHTENLLFLIHIWESDKIIGAYVSTPIEGEGIISDPNAYIFSVTGCRKFPCKHTKCIEVGNGNLIKFGRDLAIRTNCLDEESDCEWPTMFEGDASLKNPSQWLAGDRHFQIENLEVYQLVEEEIEMVM